jgi:hypothetical protein
MLPAPPPAGGGLDSRATAARRVPGVLRFALHVLHFSLLRWVTHPECKTKNMQCKTKNGEINVGNKRDANG